MILDLQFRIKNNPNYIKYLRENSYWYKILNRDPTKVDDFISEVKEKYKLRVSDKINDVIDKIDMINRFISVLR